MQKYFVQGHGKFRVKKYMMSHSISYRGTRPPPPPHDSRSWRQSQILTDSKQKDDAFGKSNDWSQYDQMTSRLVACVRKWQDKYFFPIAAGENVPEGSRSFQVLQARCLIMFVLALLISIVVSFILLWSPKQLKNHLKSFKNPYTEINRV